ncbi:hypothetical protein QQ054_22220 [Oscillatoria amoena NRMC-F 0135]|nr:hypothetical protein [Oscillatoria amoena NRMC-F 0135]
MNGFTRIQVSSRIILFLFGTALLYGRAFGQDEKEKKSLTKRAIGEGIKLISTSPKDTVVNEKSTDPYREFAGKTIRQITVERIGFERSIYDTDKKVKKTVTRVANALHTNTREKIIRRHLFFSKNQPLNPYKLSDNERFLRDKDFILDSRIVVTPIAGSDSVDVNVITRDVFSIGASAGGSFPSAPEFGVYDANVDGRGQRIEFNALVDQERTPKFGYSLLYRKSSVLGSLTNLELGFTQLNDARSIGQENEFAAFIRIDRPLVSPYSRLAGGLEVSRNWSQNVYNDPDTAFLDYKYKIVDTWIGYNMGVNRAMSNRNRQFLAFRYLDGYYNDQPDQPEYEEERRYNNAFGYLAEYTLYRQDFFKTRYVFGFGRTEDIPYGFTLGFSAGYVSQLQIARPYSAVKVNYGEASRKGNFYRLFLQFGGYERNGKMEDVLLQTGAAYFTRLWQAGKYKMRNYVSVAYTQLFNRVVYDWVEINRKEIPGFRSDSLAADKRLAIHMESAVYTPWSLLGFRFAPFVAVDMVQVGCIYCIEPTDLYWGLSSGIRTRNENLIFGTMELKFTYIPYDEYGDSKFVFGFKQNLRVKNSGSFVRKPTLIIYN